MQIKRFEAKNMTAALRLIKNELGADAVILSARSIRRGKGLFGAVKYSGVEVTAAIDSEQSPSRNLPARALHRAQSNTDRSRVRVMRSAQRRSGLTFERNRIDRLSRQSRSATQKKTELRSRNKTLAGIYQQLLYQDVDRGIASELVENIKQIPASEKLVTLDQMMVYMIDILEDIGVVNDTDPVHEQNPNVKVFIGTSGVGKTTTIAKLAAKYANRRQQRVALISIDNYGIAAFDKLNVYAKIIGLPLKSARNRSELGLILKEFKNYDVVLIDTPGINQNDRDQLAELNSFFEELPDFELHLVLSTPTKERDLIEIASKFKDMPVHRLLFTKIDESITVGNILNVLVRTSIPLSYLADGRQVPLNIKTGSLQILLNMILQPMAIPKAQSMKAHKPFSRESKEDHKASSQVPLLVANKNSEVYHCLTCKWAKRIKPENIIKFTSVHDAETQNYLPCRSCNPDQSENVDSFRSQRKSLRINSVS